MGSRELDKDAEESIGSSAGSSEGDYDEFLRAVAHAPLRKPPPHVPIGGRWGASDRYILERRLGRGGMGIVYAATDTLLGRAVALKVLDADVAAELGADALLREARLAARVEHDRVARVYDVGEHDGNLFVAMEFVRGLTLRSWMADHHRDADQSLAITIQVAEGLAALHEAGVIHRDLKPENVMMTEGGGIKLLDFGLARHTTTIEPKSRKSAPGSATPQASIVSGTPGYMAPEQRFGRSDARTDVFALGVLFHELVSGERPFKGERLDDIFTSMQNEPAFDADAWQHLSPDWRAIAKRALSAAPEDRYENGGEMLAELRKLAKANTFRAVSFSAPPSDRGSLSTMASPYERRPPKRKLPLGAIAAACVVLVAAGMVVQRVRATTLPKPRPHMVWVDVGTITVGHTREEIEAECAKIGPGCDKRQMMREVPPAKVTLDPFLLDEREVTNEQFAHALTGLETMLVVVEDEEEHYPRYVRWANGLERPEILADLYPKRGGVTFANHAFDARPGRAKEPVVQVTWFGARAYCNSVGKRLPTEDEWEAAARGKNGRRFPWGEAPPRCNGVVIPRDGLLLTDASCPEEVPVRFVGEASQDVTPEGVYDLAGNVVEWTDSGYVEGNRAAHPHDNKELPKVLKGGSWGASLLARGSGRTSRPAEFVGDNLGFRCAASRSAQ